MRNAPLYRCTLPGARPRNDANRRSRVLRSLILISFGLSHLSGSNRHSARLSKQLWPRLTFILHKFVRTATVVPETSDNLAPRKYNPFRSKNPEDTPFAYIDSASARAEINMVTRKLGKSICSTATVLIAQPGRFLAPEDAIDMRS
jgi:hypothetical protein